MAAEEEGWKRKSRRTVHPGRVVFLEIEEHEGPRGELHTLEVVRHRGASAVLALTEEGEVLLVRQYRPAIGERILEVPAGKLEEGEEPAPCAARELEEETGLRAGRLEAMGTIWTTPGFSDERIWLFLARDLEAGQQDLQSGEDLEVLRVPLAEALEKARSGEIRDAKTLAALLRAEGVLRGEGSVAG